MAKKVLEKKRESLEISGFDDQRQTELQKEKRKSQQLDLTGSKRAHMSVNPMAQKMSKNLYYEQL